MSQKKLESAKSNFKKLASISCVCSKHFEFNSLGYVNAREPFGKFVNRLATDNNDEIPSVKIRIKAKKLSTVDWILHIIKIPKGETNFLYIFSAGDASLRTKIFWLLK